jgi:hypothetical protein
MRGVLMGCDQTLNVVLKGPVEVWDTATDTLKETVQGDTMIRGQDIEHVSVADKPGDARAREREGDDSPGEPRLAIG